ncbi:hypothetical protein O3M35_009832 [Rhynocoris fuscipes]|uniref:CHK kinase-like domain-containing protein n=1 Tax=Rhynocoris fuscipes TaxID=488301 RepID=A0AAW1DBW8_9HEMI
MCTVSKEECDTIVRNYLGHDDYEIMDYHVKTADASLGLMSVVSSLKVKILINNNDIKEVSFFIKFLPQNDYHLSIVNKIGCFKKESSFLGTLFKPITSLLLYHSVPKCYLKDCDKMIVLEDLTTLGYRNCSNPHGFDLQHTYASIKALADLHAASLVYEHNIGKPLDQVFTYEILRPWFSAIEDFPGYKDNLAAADIVSRIIDKYFNENYTENVRKKAKEILFNFSNYAQAKSGNYKNVITHQDLWCNNVMFKYDNETVQDAVIIDFQMFGYNPPSFDLLTMLYCNTDKETRNQHFNDMIEYYYKCLCNNIEHHKLTPEDILSRKEFLASMEETRPYGLAAAAIFLHTVLSPDEVMVPIIEDIDKFKTYMETDRSIVLETMEKYEYYRKRVLISVQDLLDFVNKTC